MGQLVNPQPQPSLRPCPAKTIAYLGFSDPNGVLIPCGGLEGHEGLHEYRVAWSDPLGVPPWWTETSAEGDTSLRGEVSDPEDPS